MTSPEMRHRLAQQHLRVATLLEKTEKNLQIYFTRTHSLSKEYWDEVDRYLALVRQAGELELPPVSRGMKAAVESIGPFPVFLGGARKSGTTLVRNLLDGHPDLFVLPTDGMGFNWITARREKDKTAYREEILHGLGVTLIQPIVGTGPTWIAGRGHEPYVDVAGYYHYWETHLPDDVMGRLLNIVYALYSLDVRYGGGSRRMWVQKCTDNVLSAGDLIASFPDARFIHVVRHPAAIVAAQKRKQPLKGRTFRLRDEIQGAGEMMSHAARNRRRYGESVYRVIRYEDLIRDTRGTMQEIAEWLGIPFEECLLRPTVYGLPAGSNTAYADRAPDPGTVGQASGKFWEEVLSAAEVRVVTYTLRAELNEHGYGAPGSHHPLAMLASLLTLKWQYSGVAKREPISILGWMRYWLGMSVRRRPVNPQEKSEAPMNRE